ncbi:MAG: 8-amino-7-oxononanoate synthase [Phycisphaeraceae bacterium]
MKSRPHQSTTARSNLLADELGEHLAQLAQSHQLRRLEVVEPDESMVRIQGRAFINLATNDYLGLSSHPRLRQAAIQAIERYGVGAGSSRLVGGHGPLHEEIEARFAAFKHAQAALLCPTGYMANLAVLTTLVRPGDLICVDKLNHASLLDAARFSGGDVRVFPHLGYTKLERLLQRHCAGAAASSRAFIVTDSIFSMDGDAADLPTICDLAERYEAVTVVDEAHGTGVLGDSGAGLCELQGVTDRVAIVMSTASKALGCLGGVVTASRTIIDTLVNHARSFIYTTSVPPSQAASITAALDVLRDEPHRRQRLMAMSRHVHEQISDLAFQIRNPKSDIRNSPPTPIIPLITGTCESALALAAHLREHGIYAPAIRTPTVAPDAARVRLSLRADLQPQHIDQLLDALHRWQE